MKDIEYEKIRDILIGEAVLAILTEKSAVSWRAVLIKLQEKLTAETAEDRKRAARLAIEEVKAEMNRREISSEKGLMAAAANDSDDTTRH